ncbi:hypothetical protein [Cryobacterium sp. Y29]|uniref:hypothetical protein n=1 Tax=Cryobacterium sp. Y29 TaxID=2048285 RepID=UPI000CE5606A|nr:hypothetical protein [Cryobacterium sp. Y29]
MPTVKPTTCRPILKQPGDVDLTQPSILIITLDAMQTERETAAVSEPHASLIETKSRYLGTDLIQQFASKEWF